MFGYADSQSELHDWRPTYKSIMSSTCCDYSNVEVDTDSSGVVPTTAPVVTLYWSDDRTWCEPSVKGAPNTFSYSESNIKLSNA